MMRSCNSSSGRNARIESHPNHPSRGSKPRICPRRIGTIAVMRAIWSVGVWIVTACTGSSSTGSHCSSAACTAIRAAVRNAISELSTA